MTNSVLSILGAVVGILSVFGVGYAIGNSERNGHVQLLKDQIAAMEKTLTERQSELDSVKQLATEAATTDSVMKLEKAAAQIGLLGSGDIYSIMNRTLTDSSDQTTFRVRAGETRDAFDGKLFITLYDTRWGGHPGRYQATGKISAPGEDDLSLESADPGHAVRYAGFEIRLMETNVLGATFRASAIETLAK